MSAKTLNEKNLQNVDLVVGKKLELENCLTWFETESVFAFCTFVAGYSFN